jgi:hypothetical protein
MRVDSVKNKSRKKYAFWGMIGIAISCFLCACSTGTESNLPVGANEAQAENMTEKFVAAAFPSTLLWSDVKRVLLDEADYTQILGKTILEIKKKWNVSYFWYPDGQETLYLNGDCFLFSGPILSDGSTCVAVGIPLSLLSENESKKENLTLAELTKEDAVVWVDAETPYLRYDLNNLELRVPTDASGATTTGKTVLLKYADTKEMFGMLEQGPDSAQIVDAEEMKSEEWNVIKDYMIRMGKTLEEVISLIDYEYASNDYAGGGLVVTDLKENVSYSFLDEKCVHINIPTWIIFSYLDGEAKSPEYLKSLEAPFAFASGLYCYLFDNIYLLIDSNANMEIPIDGYIGIYPTK